MGKIGTKVRERRTEGRKEERISELRTQIKERIKGDECNSIF